MKSVKRFVFLCLVAVLLLCAELVALWATHAEADNGPVRVQDIGFFYKLDEKARFIDLKTQWQSANRGEISPERAGEMAREAFEAASVEAPFERWLAHGGPAPRVFTGKIHLYNTSRQALLNLPLQVTVRAKVGELRVEPGIQMTDFAHLERTARWETVSQRTVKIAALAPGEDMRLEVMQFRLLDFLARHPHQWPTEVEVRVSAPQLGAARKSLNLVPDHFVVPGIY